MLKIILMHQYPIIHIYLDNISRYIVLIPTAEYLAHFFFFLAHFQFSTIINNDVAKSFHICLIISLG